MSKKDLEQKWVNTISDKLVGKTIKEVRYISDKEARDMGWYARSVAIQLSDGEWVFPMQLFQYLAKEDFHAHRTRNFR